MAHLWEVEQFLHVRNGKLHVDGVSMPELAAGHGTPLFVFSENRIRRNIARIARAADSIPCPLKICYAAKANSTMAILRSVRDAGCDVEVNSGGELWKALEIGFRGDQIIFNGTSKEAWEIEQAIAAGVYAIQVDSLFELSLIEQAAKRLNKKACVSLRMVPEIASDTHSGLQTALLTSKFGMMPDEAFSAFRQYRNSRQLDLAGIHLHIGSQNPDPAAYTAALEMLFASIVRIYDETGIRLRHINLGGGFPVNYLGGNEMGSSVSDRQQNLLEAEFDPADAVVDAWRAAEGAADRSGRAGLLEDLTLLVEPGRSIISDAGVCLTTVRNFKQRPVNADQTVSDVIHESRDREPDEAPLVYTHDNWLLTDAGFNILLSMETYKWYYHLISADRADERHDVPYKVAGPLCDGGDVYFDIEGERRLPDHRLLPVDVQPGEVLALLNCGAYSLAQASQYNGRFLPAVVLIRTDSTAELIRCRDRFEDLVANDIF